MQRAIQPQSRSRSARHSSKPISNLNIVYRPSDELKPDLCNPRRHSKRQIQQIANSIEAFGFNVPILIDRDGNIIAGHGRWFGVSPARQNRGADAVPRSPLAGSRPARS